MNLTKSLQLYNMLKDFLPETDGDETVVQYTNKILDGIIAADEHERYIRAIELMTGKSEDDVLEGGIESAIQDFMDGIIENEIIWMRKFYEGLGWR